MINSIQSLKFHHIGIAVKDINAAISFYRTTGYIFSKVTFDPLQNVNIALGKSNDGPLIELITKGDGMSPIDSYLEKSKHQIYHMGYSTLNLQESLKDLGKILRFLPLGDRKNAIAFGNKRVSFYYSEISGLIEIIEFN